MWWPTIVLTLLAAVGLRLVWSGRKATPAWWHQSLLWGTWIGFAVTIQQTMVHVGPDKGFVLALYGFCLFGAVLVGFAGITALRTPANARRGKSRSQEGTEADKRTIFARIWIFLLAGPVAGFTAILSGYGWHLLGVTFAWQSANTLAVMLLSVPVVWALLAVLVTYQNALMKRSIGALAICALMVSVWMWT